MCVDDGAVLQKEGELDIRWCVRNVQCVWGLREDGGESECGEVIWRHSGEFDGEKSLENGVEGSVEVVRVVMMSWIGIWSSGACTVWHCGVC